MRTDNHFDLGSLEIQLELRSVLRVAFNGETQRSYSIREATVIHSVEGSSFFVFNQYVTLKDELLEPQKW
jgi:hypothetical protein